MTSCTCRSCRRGTTGTTAIRTRSTTTTNTTRTPRNANPAPAPTAAATPAAQPAPDRADVDRMAAALPADRTGWDGSPLNAKDRRFFALRDAGYTGPIDSDGYADTTSEGAAILRRVAQNRGETPNW